MSGCLLSNVICSSKRSINPLSPAGCDIIIICFEELFPNEYVVRAYHEEPKQACSRMFTTYEEGQAVYLDALKVLTNKNVNFLQVADVIMRPPFHPELNL